MSLLNQVQVYNGYSYTITDLIEASKDLKPFKIKVRDVFIDYETPNDNTLGSFIEHVKRTNKADLNFPIILSPSNFILDGKHRVAKALLLGRKYIKAVRFKIMPLCGEYIDNEIS